LIRESEICAALLLYSRNFIFPARDNVENNLLPIDDAPPICRSAALTRYEFVND
jgi:hypothetical protein